jgi:hypothetical protein
MENLLYRRSWENRYTPARTPARTMACLSTAPSCCQLRRHSRKRMAGELCPLPLPRPVRTLGVGKRRTRMLRKIRVIVGIHLRSLRQIRRRPRFLRLGRSGRLCRGVRFPRRVRFPRLGHHRRLGRRRQRLYHTKYRRNANARKKPSSASQSLFAHRSAYTFRVICLV